MASANGATLSAPPVPSGAEAKVSVPVLDWSSFIALSGSNSELIPLASESGQKRLAGAAAAGTSAYAVMSAHFRKQRGDTACGVATAATILQTAYALSGADTKFAEGSMLDGLPDPKHVISPSTGKAASAQLAWKAIKENGMTLRDVEHLINARAAITATAKSNATRTATAVTTAASAATPVTPLRACAHAIDHSLSANQQFEALIGLLRAPAGSTFVAANYYLPALGYSIDGGHHSPLAAYHAASHSVLLLDVWREYPNVWVPAGRLLAAMDSIDADSGIRRGWIAITLPTATPNQTAAASAPAAAAAAAATDSKK